MTTRLCVFLLLLLTLQRATHAQSLYGGGGVALVSTSSSHPAIGRFAQPGLQLQIGRDARNWGVEASVTLGISIATGEPPDIYYPDDTAEYGSLSVSLRRYFNLDSTSRLTPWAGLGIAFQDAFWDTYYYRVNGFGLAFSAGLDYRMAPRWRFRGSLVMSRYSTDDNYFDSPDYSGPWNSREAQIGISLLRDF